MRRLTGEDVEGGLFFELLLWVAEDVCLDDAAAGFFPM